MPVGWCESIPFERLREWRRNVSEASPYLWPIFISMMLTQIAWVGVYQCSGKDNMVNKIAGDRFLSISNNSMKLDLDLEDPNPKTLGDYTIESLQLVAYVMVIALIAFAIEWSTADSKEGKQSFAECNALFLSSFCTGSVVSAATNLLDIDPSLKPWITCLCTGVYFCGAYIAFFTDYFPARICKYYGLTNYSFLTVVVLTTLPASSFWIITTPLFFFLGLTRYIRHRRHQKVMQWVKVLSCAMGKGPDQDLQKAVPVETEEMDEDIRRFKIYEVLVPQTPDGYAMGQIETVQSNKSIVEVGEIMYGEFIACGIIVGQAMASGIIPGIFSACCVLIGVVCSVNVKNRKKLVHLPKYSEIFGFCGHLGYLIVQYVLIFLFKTTV